MQRGAAQRGALHGPVSWPSTHTFTRHTVTRRAHVHLDARSHRTNRTDLQFARICVCVVSGVLTFLAALPAPDISSIPAVDAVDRRDIQTDRLDRFITLRTYYADRVLNKSLFSYLRTLTTWHCPHSHAASVFCSP